MKKILRNLALLLIPVFLYYGVFIAFEPNNYFGLRKEPLGGNDVIARMRIYQRAPKNALVVGDSRVAKLNMDAFEKALGKPYFNLTYGGSSLTETLDILEWAIEQNPDLNEVMVGLSFYTLNEGYNHDRMIVKALDNPFVYMTNLTYNINMLETLSIVARRTMAGEGESKPALGGKGETRDPASYEFADIQDPVTGETLTMRKDLISYSVDNIGSKGQNWRLNQKELERLLELIDRCEEQGIRITIVLPPVEESVWQLVIRPNGIEEPMLQAIGQLEATSAIVLDYEFTNRPDFGQDLFYDGFHLDEERGLPVWQAMLLEDMQAAFAKQG